MQASCLRRQLMWQRWQDLFAKGELVVLTGGVPLGGIRYNEPHQSTGRRTYSCDRKRAKRKENFRKSLCVPQQ